MHTGKRIITFLFLLSFGFFIGTSAIQAGIGQSGYGWLWGGSDTGAPKDPLVSPSNYPWNYVPTGPGWISLNSSDCDSDNNGFVDAACGGDNATRTAVNYGVSIPLSDGVLSGYAWSDRYGWISFNAADVAGCPSGTCNARRVGNALQGWARILSFDQSTEGLWKGFIALDATSAGSSLTYNGVAVPSVTINADNTLSGYIYSDEIGWVDVSRARIQSVPTLQLCRDGVPFAVGGETRTMALNLKPAAMSTANMTTYFDGTPGDCAGTDVTAATNFTDTASLVVTVSPFGSTPNVFTGNDIPGSSAAGQQSASETVTVSYAGQTITIPVTVTEFCVSSCPAEEAKHCPGTFDTVNSCGGPETCTGTRSCDFNWKEVAPE